MTDKAVSRWERGLGFPDIQLLEPLAQALEVRLVELMQSQLIPEITAEQASHAVADTVKMADLQQKRRQKQGWLVLGALLVLGAVCWVVLCGCFVRQDVYLQDHSVIYHPNGDLITIRTGVSSPMGYTRDYRDLSDDPARMELAFYSAFGGPNGKLGAKNVFLLEPAPQCTRISFVRSDGLRVELQKDPDTGKWMKP